MQPSSPEAPQPRKRRRVEASRFLDIEAAADGDDEEEEDIDEEEEEEDIVDEEEEGFGMYQPPLTSGEK